MTKTLKRFFTTIMVSILMIFSLFTVASCVSLGGKEITAEFAYAKLNEDIDGRTRKEILLDSYKSYKYLELEYNIYDEETLELKETTKVYIRNVLVKKDETIKKLDQQVFIDSYSYETEVTKYSLLKRELNCVKYYTSIKEDGDIVKNSVVELDFTAFEDYINELMPTLFNDSYLPEDESSILEAYKKTIAMDVDKLLTLDIRFKNSDNVLRGVVFNYNTNKIHHICEYNEDGAILYEVEYTYPGNNVTEPKDINYDLFAMDKDNPPIDPEDSSSELPEVNPEDSSSDVSVVDPENSSSEILPEDSSSEIPEVNPEDSSGEIPPEDNSSELPPVDSEDSSSELPEVSSEDNSSEV